MKIVFIILASLFTLNSSASDLNADQLASLSDCDYFKYNSCSAEDLTIGACVKAKYDGFVKACGKIHADKYTYSREMFKPELDPKKKKGSSCDSVQTKLCAKAGLGLRECASQFTKEISAACGKDFMEGINSKEAKKYDECFSLRKKECGNEIGPACDARFQAKAPAFCKTVTAKSKSSAEGVPSEEVMMNDCMGGIQSKCKMDENEILKDGVDPAEYVRKYQECVKRTLKSATGKCGKHFEVESRVKEMSKE
jgi:hypothetical protein